MEYITNIGFSEDIIFPDELRKAPRRKGETQVLLRCHEFEKAGRMELE